MMVMITLIRLLIGSILVIAGLAKALMNGDRFYKTVVAYDLLPSWIAKLFAKWLPWLELAMGTMMIFGIWTRLVAAVSMGVLGIFAIAVCVSLFRNKDINCGCFGRISEKVGWRVVIRNIVLLILSLLVYTHKGGVARVVKTSSF